jgi:hypothetical protein
MIKAIIKFFDKLEDHIRGFLSPHPILYGIIAGTALILFWRGIWETASLYNLHPIASIIIGLVGLLLTGVFVSAFIGTRLIISGLKGDKKIEEKTIEEIKEGEETLTKIYRKLEKIDEEVQEMKEQK